MDRSLWREGRMRKPKLRLVLGDNCTQKCVFCSRDFNATKHSKMSLEFAKECINAFLDTSGDTVCFSGGEPLLYPELSTLIELTKSRGLRAQITTNGTLLGSLSDRLLNELDVIHISLNSLENSTHKIIAGASPKYNLELILNNIEKLLSKNISFKINCIYLKKYPTAIEGVIDYCLDRSIPVRIMNDMLDDGDYFDEYLKFTKNLPRNTLIKYRKTTNPGFEACSDCSLNMNCASTRAVWCFPNKTIVPCPYQKKIIAESCNCLTSIKKSYSYILS